MLTLIKKLQIIVLNFGLSDYMNTMIKKILLSCRMTLHYQIIVRQTII